MKLTVHERLKLLELMPEKSTFAGVKEIHRTTLLLMLNNDEVIEIEAKHEDGVLQWNQDKALTLIVDVPIGEWMTEIIRGVLRKKDDEGDLGPAEISIFEKFILDYE